MKSASPEVIIITLFYLLRCVVPSKEKDTLTKIHCFDIIQFLE